MAHGRPKVQRGLGGLHQLKDIGHDGYQFYTDFSPENESRVATSLRFQRRLPQGSPWGSHFKELNDSRHVGYQSHSILSSDNQYRVAMVKTYKKATMSLKLF